MHPLRRTAGHLRTGSGLGPGIGSQPWRGSVLRVKTVRRKNVESRDFTARRRTRTLLAGTRPNHGQARPDIAPPPLSLARALTHTSRYHAQAILRALPILRADTSPGDLHGLHNRPRQIQV